VAYTNSSISLPATILNEMLRTYVPSVQKRVYPPGIRVDAQMPRITITPLSPQDGPTWLGEGFGGYKGKFMNWTFRVDIWDRDPTQIEKISSEVDYAVWKHRSYVPTAAADAAKGEFALLRINGGGAITMNEKFQLYQRTLNVTGLWLSKSAETWQ
jgi:hypothetical protein